MHSLAARHRRQTEAGQNHLKNSDPADVPADMALTVIQNQFYSDLNRIRAIKSRRSRMLEKQRALPKYREWVDQFIQQTGWSGRQEQMFVWLLVWCIDGGVWGQALLMAEHAIKLQLSQPNGFDRSLVEAVTEELSDSVLAADPAGHTVMLEHLRQLVEGQDMSDLIRAKLYRALGMAHLSDDPEQAESLFEKALLFHPKAGVKRQLALLKKQGGRVESSVAAGNIQDYSLSATQAGKLAGMSTPTIIRHAKKQPDKLPHLKIPTGKRTLYRFNPRHIRAYMKNHLIKKQEKTS